MTSIQDTVETDEHGFPRALPFWAEDNTVTRAITIPAADVHKEDLLGVIPGEHRRRVIATPVHADGKVTLTVRFDGGQTRDQDYAPAEMLTVQRTKTYGARMPDQRSVTDQLRDLIAVANRMGMYDAADYLRQTISR